MTDLKAFAKGVEDEKDPAKLGLLLEQTEDHLKAAREAHDPAEVNEVSQEVQIVLDALSLRQFEAGARTLSPEQLGELLEQQEGITQSARASLAVTDPERVMQEKRLIKVEDLLAEIGRNAA